MEKKIHDIDIDMNVKPYKTIYKSFDSSLDSSLKSHFIRICATMMKHPITIQHPNSTHDERNSNYKKCLYLLNCIENQDITINIKKVKHSSLDILSRNSFIDPRIQKEIKKNIKNSKILTCKEYPHIIIQLIADKPEINYQKMIQIIAWFCCIYQYNPEKYGNINICCMETSFKKQLPAEKHITPFEVNSGSTHFYNSKAYLICLWRNEEWEKVLIHELCHYFRNDVVIPIIDYHDVYNVCKNDTIIIQEAITETLAIILVNLYNCSFDFELFKTRMEIEIYHSFHQAALILKHFGFQSIQEFLKKNNNQSLHKCLHQSTNVDSYYIVKSGILLQYCEFLTYWNQFKCDFVKIKLIDSFIIKSLHDTNYSKMINYFINKKITNTSLRMTCLIK